jgi:predicted transcriptional regulator
MTERKVHQSRVSEAFSKYQSCRAFYSLRPASRVDVAIEKSEDVLAVERLHVLGVADLTEWDALTFLYRHGASLCTAAQIARLIGYDKADIAAAIHRLEGLGFIQRSRVSQGIRLYRFSAPPESSRQSSLLELMNQAQNRAGRLLLLKHLKRPAFVQRRRRDGGLRLA